MFQCTNCGSSNIKHRIGFDHHEDECQDCGLTVDAGDKNIVYQKPNNTVETDGDR